MKSIDANHPPSIVCKGDDASQCLYICIPENNSTERIDESMNDVPLLTAKIDKTKISRLLLKSLKITVTDYFILTHGIIN